ncbi:MAG: Fic family protein [Prevotellaceae bacterium]|jgi:fido (protein-threonine AMPylation protein)|nr:Fic family protein [Prevotellaceae bacterium]
MVSDFDEYIRQGEPDKVEKSRSWQTAIGLQQVDGLTPSAYLIETAKQNIEGKITIDEVKYRIDSYYKQQASKTTENYRTEEADKVSANIAEILSEKTFTFSPAELLAIHKRLFTGVENIRVKVGKVRDYNITKSEWVLNGKTVYYASADTINATLDYDFKQEKQFNYKGLSKREIVEHIANFISRLWQIHAFGEGNTRTIAVFTIKYLRTFGFDVENDMFAQHSWYFRNALVRANYNDTQNKIYATQEYLMRFFGNLLLGEHNELKNRYLHININNDVIEEQNVSVNKKEGGQKDDLGGQKDNLGGQKKFSEQVVRLLDLIIEKPNITRKELSEALQINPSAVQKHIQKLKNEGVISREGSDKKGFWRITIRDDANHK